MRILRMTSQTSYGWVRSNYFLIKDGMEFDDIETLKDDYDNYISMKKSSSKKKKSSIEKEFTFEQFLKDNYGFERVDCVDFSC